MNSNDCPNETVLCIFLMKNDISQKNQVTFVILKCNNHKYKIKKLSVNCMYKTETVSQRRIHFFHRIRLIYKIKIISNF